MKGKKDCTKHNKNDRKREKQKKEKRRKIKQSQSMKNKYTSRYFLKFPQELVFNPVQKS